MDMDDAEDSLKQAAVCREEANKALNLIEAASWLRLAEDFEKRGKLKNLRKRRRPPSLWIEPPPADAG
ncbi:hypothetical protein [Bradyrhizobium sp. URHC0002]